MRIIPAIDIINGNCVRLTKGDYNTQKTYYKDPLDMAKMLEDAGISYLHMVDLDGAKSNRIINHKVLERVCAKTNLNVDFGGGIKSDEDIHIAFECGASQITGGSIAVKNEKLFLEWLARYGADKIILGADCKDRRIATQGWLEQSDADVIDFISEYKQKGIEYVICTDIEKDGMLQGPSIELYKEILSQETVKLIASGGVTTIDELMELKSIGCEGAIIGKAIYEGNISLKELKKLC